MTKDLEAFIQHLKKANFNNKVLPLHETRFNQEDASAVAKVVSEGNVSALGNAIAEFESEIGEIVGSKFTVAVSSGTAGRTVVSAGGGVTT